MIYKFINLQQKFGLFREPWEPKVIAEMNDYQFKIGKLKGDFVWHDHKDTDEACLVIDGNLRIDFRDGAVHLGRRDVRRPQRRGAQRGVLNTGDAGGERTAQNDVWV